jgi:quercetin dioxygenase-like cupin family protein
VNGQRDRMSARSLADRKPIEPGGSKNYNCTVGNFSQGCNAGWRVHDCDQILIVTSGGDIMATEHDQRETNVGDVAHSKTGERHWHGAKADTIMGHITITSLAVRLSGDGRDTTRR